MESVNAFTYDYVHLYPHEQIDLHVGESFELSYIITGSGLKLIGDMRTPFKRGEVVLIPPGMPHCWYFDDHDVDDEGRIANICVFFLPQTLERIASIFPQLKESVGRLLNLHIAIKFDQVQAAKIRREMEEMRQENDSQRVASFVNLLYLLSHDGQSEDVGEPVEIRKEKRLLQQIDTYIICNAKRGFRLDDIMGHVGMARSTFCAFFKKATGMSFVTYLIEYRIRMAGKLLQETKLSISEVCYECGFNNVPCFNRTFKRITGMNPTEYRNTMKEGEASIQYLTSTSL